MDIGKRLQDLREGNCISQGDVEARTGLTQEEISNIESGQGTPTLPMLEKWAKALGVDLHQLLLVLLLAACQ